MSESIKIYSSPGCGSCSTVKEAIESGNVEVRGVDPDTEVEMVDVTTDEGYPEIDRIGIDAIPSAYHEGEKCNILVNDQTGKVIVDCPDSRPREKDHR